MVDLILGKEFTDKVIPFIDQAKKSVHIVVFDWRWYPNDVGSPAQLFNQSIVRASKRGVEVLAVTNFDSIAKTLARCGVIAKKLAEPALVHVKLMLIDGKIAILGSHNYTQNAFCLNYEVSAIIDDVPTTERLQEYFRNIWAK